MIACWADRLFSVCRSESRHLWGTPLRTAVEDILPKLSEEQRHVVSKALHDNPKKFKNMLKRYMDLKENQFLKEKKEQKRRKLDKAKKLLEGMEIEIEKIRRKCDSVPIELSNCNNSNSSSLSNSPKKRPLSRKQKCISFL